MCHAVILEKGQDSYDAYVPDLPGWVAVGDTVEEVKTLIQEAIDFHLESMIEDGDDIPQPSSFVEYIETQIPA